MSTTDAGPWTVARLLTWTREYFQRSGVESPRLCAEILLAHALECPRIQLYTRYEAVPAEPVLARFRATVQRVTAGQPIAYVTGTKEFFSLPFRVSPDVLIPRPETEILVERTIDLVRRGGGRLRTIADVGTGSGCIAICLARHLPDARVFASDVSEAALAVARENAARHELTKRITFRTGDLLDAWPVAAADDVDGGPALFDVIVANLPYISEPDLADLPAHIRDAEPRLALYGGADGLGPIRRLIEQAPARLQPGGHLLLEIGHDQAARVRALLKANPWQDCTVYGDGAGHERVAHARRRSAAEAAAPAAQPQVA